MDDFGCNFGGGGGGDDSGGGEKKKPRNTGRGKDGKPKPQGGYQYIPAVITPTRPPLLPATLTLYQPDSEEFQVPKFLRNMQQQTAPPEEKRRRTELQIADDEGDDMPTIAYDESDEFDQKNMAEWTSQQDKKKADEVKAKKEAEAEPVVKKAAFFASEQRELDAAFAEDDAEAGKFTFKATKKKKKRSSSNASGPDRKKQLSTQMLSFESFDE